MSPYRERRITARDGLSLYCRDYGSPGAAATPVLCLAGLTRNSADFTYVAQRLAPSRRVLTLDYRGRGRSEHDRRWRNYHPLTDLDDIAQLLAATGIHRVVVIGTSLGGLLAMGLAVLKPTCVAGVVLNDVGPDLQRDGLGRLLEYFATDRPQPDWRSAAAYLRSVFDLSLASETEWLEFARATYREGADGLLHFDWDLDIAKAVEAGLGAPQDLWPLFRSLRDTPALALRGERSDILSRATFERMAQELPGIAAVTVANCGHTPTLGEPEAVAAIDELLTRI